ncbi:MAG TPA: hypothetical protein GYA08_24140 [Chloroflexi bacterium]|nr:hypothetical protein [Chloroflexota bacterium]
MLLRIITFPVDQDITQPILDVVIDDVVQLFVGEAVVPGEDAVDLVDVRGAIEPAIEFPSG